MQIVGAKLQHTSEEVFEQCKTEAASEGSRIHPFVYIYCSGIYALIRHKADSWEQSLQYSKRETVGDNSEFRKYYCYHELFMSFVP